MFGACLLACVLAWQKWVYIFGMNAPVVWFWLWCSWRYPWHCDGVLFGGVLFGGCENGVGWAWSGLDDGLDVGIVCMVEREGAMNIQT